jgi:hypothetical protein
MNLYKSAKEVKMPPERKLAAFRDLVLGARTARISVNESTSEVSVILARMKYGELNDR